MRTFLFILLMNLITLLIIFGGIFAHEHDMANNCYRDHNAHAFFVNINC